MARQANYVFLSGKGAWLHRLFEYDEYKGNKFWSMRLYPDPKSLKTFQSLGLNNHIKKDDEGTYVTLRRSVDKKWTLKPGEKKEFDPPIIVDKDGELWNDRGLIGNGSAVTVKLETYTSAKGAGSRIESVRVDDWIKYEVPNDAPSTSDDDNKLDDPLPF